MRKLLILMLVIGLASMASARGTLSLSIDVDGSAYDAATNGVYDGALVKVTFNDSSVVFGDLGPAALTLSVDSGSAAGNFWWNHNAPLWAAASLDGWSIDPQLTPTAVGDGLTAVVSGQYEWQNNMIGPPTSGDEFSFEFTAGGESVTIDVTAGSYSSDSAFGAVGSADGYPYVTLVPEPMTIALLGLGGLFLRRRK